MKDFLLVYLSLFVFCFILIVAGDSLLKNGSQDNFDHKAFLRPGIKYDDNFDKTLRSRYSSDIIEPNIPIHDFKFPVGGFAVLPCFINTKLNKTSRTSITWWIISQKHTQIGNVVPSHREEFFMPTEEYMSLNGTYFINQNDGSLIVKNLQRQHVESYLCVQREDHSGHVLWLTMVRLRLDLSNWFNGPWSLFYGSLIMSLIFCFAFVVINLLWVVLRNFALWWIRRLERLSQVRAMITMVENYKQRQLDSLHRTYHRRVSTIRENYHNQLEQLRQSYTSQTDRFREWGQAGKENVQAHFDTIKDNYNQQVSRLREFGSRQTECIWESYDRRMNTIRTFTLQQRLRICNHYKVKQRYVNKLLEAIAETTNVDNIRQKEAAIRAVFDDIPPLSHSTETLLVATKPINQTKPIYVQLQSNVKLQCHQHQRVTRSASVPSVFHEKSENLCDKTNIANVDESAILGGEAVVDKAAVRTRFFLNEDAESKIRNQQK